MKQKMKHFITIFFLLSLILIALVTSSCQSVVITSYPHTYQSITTTSNQDLQKMFDENMNTTTPYFNTLAIVYQNELNKRAIIAAIQEIP